MTSVFAISVSKAIRREIARYQNLVRKYDELEANELVFEELTRSRIVLFSHTTCPAAKRAKKFLAQVLPPGTTVNIVEVDDAKFEKELRDVLQKLTGFRSVPQIFVDTKFVGGEAEIARNEGANIIMKFLEKGFVKFEDEEETMVRIPTSQVEQGQERPLFLDGDEEGSQTSRNSNVLSSEN
eukprot:TRINITY_DN24117_c0_g1_i2.p2 TRINITY_DN24117_c0_g1~~TRINITY_DN24117_c0_g1_i2.p2  ORF type:complete len:182 (+),score=26.62 TRINITY_DN24117_c0_g1_i2:113-658(+)